MNNHSTLTSTSGTKSATTCKQVASSTWHPELLVQCQELCYLHSGLKGNNVSTRESQYQVHGLSSIRLVGEYVWLTRTHEKAL